MDLLQTVIITMQIATALSKWHASSSDESIENLLYYKDCQRKAKPKEAPKPEPKSLRAAVPPAPKPFECPFPKMCCSMTCNNECGGGGPPSIFGRQTEGSPMTFNQPSPPHQPQLPPMMMDQRGHRKKVKPPLLPPIGARREFGFTKERIKSLIAKDEDIRKILKDLVRVTMQKVDLVAMINSRRAAEANKVEKSNSNEQELEME